MAARNKLSKSDKSRDDDAAPRVLNRAQHAALVNKFLSVLVRTQLKSGKAAGIPKLLAEEIRAAGSVDRWIKSDGARRTRYEQLKEKLGPRAAALPSGHVDAALERFLAMIAAIQIRRKQEISIPRPFAKLVLAAGSVENWIEGDEAIRTLYEATYKRVLVSEAERLAKRLPRGAAPPARIEPQLPHLPLSPQGWGKPAGKADEE
ncbi:MAG TPA: hypothetical protein VKQ27_13620 [Acetobacteraceae bacterium]|nr:hypothetical protein [Acetobacteraceae bacterium]